MMFLQNALPWFWLAIMVILIVIEAFTFSLTTIWGAIACIPLIFIARTQLEFKWQILIFAFLSLILLVFTRPFAVKKLKISKTNVNGLIGQDVIVTKKIGTLEKGEVKSSAGVIWSAKSRDGSEIKSGTVCSIVALSGNTLEVEAKKDSEKQSV
ncbi:MAG: NfeD family protein [Treponema sp.]